MPAPAVAPRPARAAPRPNAAPTPYEAHFALVPDGVKADLVDGTILIDVSASLTHERLQFFLLFLLGGYNSARGLGLVLGSRTLMRVDDANAFEPDVLFVRQDRVGIVTERAVEGPVDVAVEIVSPSSAARDRETKFVGYERAGVPEYWLVDPERREALFYRLDGAPYEPGGVYRAMPLPGGVFESAAVPGFRLDPQDLFADPLPNEFERLQALLAA